MADKQKRRVIAVVKLNDLEDYIKRNGLRDVRITLTDQGLIMEEKSQ